MTPKEKAKELIEKYDEMLTYLESKSKAKQCALIAVDEIMLQYKTPIVSHIITTYKSAKDFDKNFLEIERQLKDFTVCNLIWWNEVKHEIEKLLKHTTSLP